MSKTVDSARVCDPTRRRNSRPSKLPVRVIALLGMALLVACGSSGGGGGDSDLGTGTLAVSLTDSAGSYKAVYITIEGIQVHIGGNDNNKNNYNDDPWAQSFHRGSRYMPYTSPGQGVFLGTIQR